MDQVFIEEGVMSKRVLVLAPQRSDRRETTIGHFVTKATGALKTEAIGTFLVVLSSNRIALGMLSLVPWSTVPASC